jgi:hypothetical protein
VNSLSANPGTFGVVGAGVAAVDDCITIAGALPGVGSVFAVQSNPAPLNTWTAEYIAVKSYNAALIAADANCVGPDNVIVERARFGSTAIGAVPWLPTTTTFPAASKIDPLHASVPTICNAGYSAEPLCTSTQPVGGSVGAGTYPILRFDIAAKGENSVTFNKAAAAVYAPATDDVIEVNFIGSTAVGEVGVCDLRDVSDGGKLLDTVNLAAVALGVAHPLGEDVEFNFDQNALTISAGTKHTLEVQCALNIVGATGRSVSAKILEAASSGTAQLDAVAPATIVYNDGELALVTEPGALIENLPILGNSFNATP